MDMRVKGAGNAATKFSIQNGDTHVVGDATYRGRPPQYKYIHPQGPMMPGAWVKTAKGIPFVRVRGDKQ